MKYAQPADLIEFDRGVYKHWAMYLGDGWIINVPAESKNDTEVTISRERLVNVAGNSKVRVNNQEALATKYGYTKRSKTTAIQAATQDIGKTFPYSFMGKNCEFYSTKWLYGNGFSTQVGHYISEVSITSCSYGPLANVSFFTRLRRHSPGLAILC